VNSVSSQLLGEVLIAETLQDSPYRCRIVELCHVEWSMKCRGQAMTTHLVCVVGTRYISVCGTRDDVSALSIASTNIRVGKFFSKFPVLLRGCNIAFPRKNAPEVISDEGLVKLKTAACPLAASHLCFCHAVILRRPCSSKEHVFNHVLRSFEIGA